MRTMRTGILAVTVALLAAPSASAHTLHTVRPGDTLWSIAARANLTTRTVATFNGLPVDGQVILGTTIRVPSIAEGRDALVRAGVLGGTGAAASVSGAPRALGAYIVRPGDTLTGLAAQTGVSAAQMAYMNGLSPTSQLLIGTILKLPTGAPAPTRASIPAPAVRVVPSADPAPTNVRLSAEQIKALAAQHGAPGALTAAIAWQESGFNNAVVSPANARGIMQVMPGTWSWVNSNLAPAPLDPHSAADNVRAGALYIASLLRQTGGDARLAAAGYYQGLASVRARGMFDDTKRYVDDVMALRTRFGG